MPGASVQSTNQVLALAQLSRLNQHQLPADSHSERHFNNSNRNKNITVVVIIMIIIITIIIITIIIEIKITIHIKNGMRASNGCVLPK